MSLLVIQKILGLLVNTWTTSDNYSLLDRDELTQPIQSQIFKKEKKILDSFLNFWNLHQKLNILKKNMTLKGYKIKSFKKKNDPQGFYISETKDCQRRAQINGEKASFHKTIREVTW